MKNSTPYPDINVVLDDLTQGIQDILGENLVGVYLTGSLSYGDFNPESSDIDIVAILHAPATVQELARLEEMHVHVGEKHPKWTKRIEASYTPLVMFRCVLPPQAPRPYLGEGTFYPEAQYGNEWIINNYWLYHASIPLAGPDFKTLMPPIEFAEVQKASLRDLFREWEPKLRDIGWLNNPHYQSYLVINLCRILYTVLQGKLGSKKVSAAWVKGAYPQWASLIEAAETWNYGKKLEQQAETLDFLRFVIGIITATDLYPTIENPTAW